MCVCMEHHHLYCVSDGTDLCSWAAHIAMEMFATQVRCDLQRFFQTVSGFWASTKGKKARGR